jgi:hypothetical protein
MRMPELELEFSSVGSTGDYPAWIRELRGHSGAYVIVEMSRDRGVATVVYVGESHANRLYQTLTRHWQQWRRRKKWWVGQYGRIDAPGTTYVRARSLAAAVLTPPELAIATQNLLIEQLRPRDNVVGQIDELEPAPF